MLGDISGMSNPIRREPQRERAFSCQNLLRWAQFANILPDHCSPAQNCAESFRAGFAHHNFANFRTAAPLNWYRFRYNLFLEETSQCSVARSSPALQSGVSGPARKSAATGSRTRAGNFAKARRLSTAEGLTMRKRAGHAGLPWAPKQRRWCRRPNVDGWR
jgi:hypothetical protein